MLKLLKKKLIIGLISTATVVGVSTQTLFMLHNANTKRAQTATIKEKNTQNVAVEQNNNENKELNSLVDEENQNNIDTKSEEVDNLQLENIKNSDNINDKETSNYQLNNSNNNNITKQENIISKPEQPSNNNEANKSTTAANYQVKVDNSSNINTESTNNINTVQEPKVNNKTIDYDRTTRIYDNDEITLIRVEYYKNNKLAYYSIVEQFDATTKSYVENIFNCNCEPVRTDTYSNGSLVKSETKKGN